MSPAPTSTAGVDGVGDGDVEDDPEHMAARSAASTNKPARVICIARRLWHGRITGLRL